MITSPMKSSKKSSGKTLPEIIGAPLRLAAILIGLLLVGAACSNSADITVDAAGTEDASSSGSSSDGSGADQSSPGETTVVEVNTSGSDSTGATSVLAELITELPPAPTGLPVAEEPGRTPIGLTIESLGVDVATVINVGVEPNGDMEIPPADEVGWYGFGPSPGETGSSVLAAHIAFDGEDGVFVNLDKLELGSVIRVSYDDGTSADFEAITKEQYEKEQLPRDSIFARDGAPQLVLITCGGDFNSQIRSYEDNVVVYANPIAES